MTGLPLSQRYRPQLLQSARSFSEPHTIALRRLIVPVLVSIVALAQIVKQPEYPLVPWLVGLAFGCFVLLFHRPVWAVAAVLVSELTLYSYYTPTFGMSQRLALTTVAIALTFPFLLRWGTFSDPRFQRVMWPVVGFIIIATIGNVRFSEFDYVMKYLRYQVVQVFVLILAAMLIRSRADLKRIAVVALVFGTLGAFFAIWQHYAPTSSPYGEGTADSIHNWNGRSIGISSNPISLADQLAFVLAPLLGYLLAGRWTVNRRTILLGFAFAVIAAGLNFTYTRSAVFAFGPALFMIGLLLKGYKRWAICGAVVAMIVIFPMLETTGLIGARYFRDASDDQSARSHDALWDVGLSIALDNPVEGIGHEQFEDIVASYMFDPMADPELGVHDALGQRPHNDFLSVWLSWGIFALLAYLLIFIGTLRNLWVAARTNDVLIRGLSIGCVGGVIVYAVNSAYHNNLDSSMFLFLYAGLSFALVRLSALPSDAHSIDGSVNSWKRSIHNPNQAGGTRRGGWM